MRNIKLLGLLLLAVIFTFSSCGDEDAPKPKTNKELLTVSAWKVSKIKMDGIDVTNEPEAAYMKNTRLKFNQDGTYTMTTTGDSDNGVWEFINNENSIVLDRNTEEEETYDITEINSNSLKIRTTVIYEDSNGDIDTVLLELDLIIA